MAYMAIGCISLLNPRFHDNLNGGSSSDPYDGPASIVTSLSADLPSPASPNHSREGSKSFFSNLQATPSSSSLTSSQGAPKQIDESQPAEAPKSQGHLQQDQTEPTSDLALARVDPATTDAASSHTTNSSQQDSVTSSKPDSSSQHNIGILNKKAPNKHRFQVMARSGSVRTDDASMLEPKSKAKSKSKPSTPNRLEEQERKQSKHKATPSALKTAPMEKDRSFREMMNSTMRTRSADRHPVTRSEDDGLAPPKDKSQGLSSSYRESGHNSFLSNFKSGGSKAADGIGKAGKFLGKFTRSGSNHEKEPAVEEHYVCTLIQLPLVEQTRRTRISKRLADSKDKTEFWMPALPWRCIDYLNYKGCEEEGLYRIPGSGREIKHWQMRFDKELDINLFDEPDLYDINIIGSMFKAWLRDLPDEIFPKETQARIHDACAGATETPQMLKDELSMLPPFNYYLLFAITCHISLLHTHSDKNKMDYKNLCICFQPCMKIDSFCFNFLVCDWKKCWQGCWTEKEYLEAEYSILDNPPSSAGRGAVPASQQLVDERAISSSSSSKPSTMDRSGRSTPDREQLRPPPFEHARQPSQSQSKHSRQPSSQGGNVTPTPRELPEVSNELPTLAPMQPLSPFGL
ncbi:hypothetical protein B0A49_07902 [Cryomyces minteri]|uniref:Rho-GAP domain-containing protein n=1 Tax=Cryomyces minteri TaxID=331657 RepID=A0A4U0WSA5_9PEZI|nr:hypothetical protein B0A49_07902 [Cryomyces minteri]